MGYLASSYRDLVVWQKSMELTAEVYRLARKLPKEETYALSDQIRRSAVSVPSNIAEGQDRNSSRVFSYFLNVARGSRAELETQLLICLKIGYLTESDVAVAMALLNEIGKMLTTLISKLKTEN